MDAIWDAASSGASVSEIWQAISASRDVGRTTVLNQVDRLEKRGWLIRREDEDALRYVATCTREEAAQNLVEEFVDSYFGGSANAMVMSLLGTGKVKPSDIPRLRALLDESLAARKKRKPK